MINGFTNYLCYPFLHSIHVRENLDPNHLPCILAAC